MNLKSWVLGVYSEVEFWRVWTRTKGAFWRDEYVRRLQGNRALDDQAASLLPPRPPGELRILDVGSGPFSGLGTSHQGHSLSITAADPLAPAYEEIARIRNLQPPIRPTLAFAEDLGAFFPMGAFDLVVCQNALDHTFEPIRAVRQMLEVCRTDCHVLLRHARNEAENERYSGLHQWNLDANAEGKFVIWNRNESVDVNQALSGIAEVTLLSVTQRHIVVALRKTANASLFSPDDYRDRLRDVLTGLSDTATQIGRDDWLLGSCMMARTYVGYALKTIGSALRRRRA